LNQPQPALGKNGLQGAAVPSGPVGRLTGLDLRMELFCYAFGDAPRSLGANNWKGPVCTLQAQKLIPTWVERHSMDTRGGVEVMSLYKGIQVEVRVNGHLRVFDIPTLMSFLADFAVYMTFPPRFFRFIVVCCLGHLSVIHKEVLNEQFNLGQHAAASVVHAICASLSFEQLANKKKGVTLQQLSEKLSHEFQGFQELDPGELSELALFCFNVVSDPNTVKSEATDVKATMKRRLSTVPSMFGKTVPNLQGQDHVGDHFGDTVASVSASEADERVLDLKSWMTAASLAYKVQLESLVKLFDQDRHLGVVERWCLPSCVPSTDLRSERLVAQEFQRANMSKDMPRVSDQNLRQGGVIPGPYDDHEQQANADQLQNLSELVETHGQQLAQHEVILEQEQHSECCFPSTPWPDDAHSPRC